MILVYEYQAKIVRVVDGDTVHAEVDLGFDIRFTMKLRLMGINAPELRTDDGKSARDFLMRLLMVNGEYQTCTIRTEKDRTEKYGRYLATIFVPSGEFALNVNLEMIENGYAVPYYP